MKKIIISIFLFTSQIAYAKKIAILLYVSEEQGNKIYEEYTKDLGFDRKLSIGKFKDIEYHVTLGFVEDVKTEDTKKLKTLIYKELKPLSNGIKFKFCTSSMLGKTIPYIVAIPDNIKIFRDLNLQISVILSQFKNGMYHLNGFTDNNQYIPHMSLNARLFNNLNILDLPKTLKHINDKMKDSEIVLNRLVVKIE